MTDKEAYDFMCSLCSKNAFHIKVRYIQLRDPDQLILMAQNHMRSPQSVSVLNQCVSHTFDKLIKKHKNL